MTSAFNDNYPDQYESRLRLMNGREIFIRPIRSTDESFILDLFDKLGSDSIYMRFLSPLSVLPEDLLFRSTHIDYHANFALVAVIREDGKDSFIASARYGYDSGENLTDFAIVVRDDWQGMGLGKLLLVKIFDIGKEHCIHRFVSIIDSANHVMKHIVRNLGYTVKYSYGTGATKVEIFV
jgi:acetyltransferase